MTGVQGWPEVVIEMSARAGGSASKTAHPQGFGPLTSSLPRGPLHRDTFYRAVGFLQGEGSKRDGEQGRPQYFL